MASQSTAMCCHGWVLFVNIGGSLIKAAPFVPSGAMSKASLIRHIEDHAHGLDEPTEWSKPTTSSICATAAPHGTQPFWPTQPQHMPPLSSTSLETPIWLCLPIYHRYHFRLLCSLAWSAGHLCPQSCFPRIAFSQGLTHILVMLLCHVKEAMSGDITFDWSKVNDLLIGSMNNLCQGPRLFIFRQLSQTSSTNYWSRNNT